MNVAVKAPRKTPLTAFPLRMALANLGVGIPLFGPIVVTLALRVEQIDPANKEANLAMVLAWGAFLATVGNPLAGRFSDRCMSRFGMRRPWIIGGMLGAAIGLVTVATAPSVLLLTAGWSLTQLSLNATIAALIATIPDQMDPAHYGASSGAANFGQTAAYVIGAAAAWFAGNALAMFLVPLTVGFVLIGWFCWTLKSDVRRTEQPGPFSWREFFSSFWRNPVKHPDFGWAFATRFLSTFALTIPLTYTAYFAMDTLDLPKDQQTFMATTLVMINTACTAVTAGIGGWVADRFGRIKPFVIGSAILISLGLLLLAFAPGLPVVVAAQIIIGLAVGMYYAVDTAMCTAVLPDRATAAKDLGVLNIAWALPQTVAPMTAPYLLNIGGGHNYVALFLISAAVGLLGAVLVQRIKAVR